MAMVVAGLLRWHAPPVLVLCVVLLLANRKLNHDEDCYSYMDLEVVEQEFKLIYLRMF